MRIVAPFRPFPPEAGHHIELADFDWMDAIRMMSESARLACGCDVRILTDFDTELPFPTFKYASTHRRLMLWYLEIAALYLESDDFDCDTVMLDSDQLVYGNLAGWFSSNVDLGICIRKPPKDAPGLPILNGVQFWSVRAKPRLAAFYRRALEIATTLPEKDLIWGADTEALRILLEPLAPGLWQREGLAVRLIDSNEIIQALSSGQIRALDAGKLTRPARPVLCFRNLRKPFMRPVFEATLASLVSA